MKSAIVSFCLAALALPAFAANCSGLPSVSDLKNLLAKAPTTGGDEGGLFHGRREWAVVVNREGQVCAVAVSTTDPTQVTRKMPTIA